MRAIYPSRTFKVLIGTGIILALLLVVAISRAIIAGCPEGWAKGDLLCLFLPAHTDLGTHLLTYVFMGTILLGVYSWLVVWRRQWSKTRLLIGNLALLHAPGSKLERLTRRLGLKDKVHLLDYKAPLCFCAGFIFPQIYLSRGMVEKLAPPELEALLLHEKHHLENYDPLKILLGRLVVSALFFIPALRDILERYLIEKEIAADRSAIRYQGHNRGIASALEKLLPECPGASAEGLAAGATDALGYRINYLTGHAPQHVHRIPVSRLAISFLIIALILATILGPLPSHPLNSDLASTVFSYLAPGITL